MRKTEPPKLDTKTLLEHILASQVLLLARQLRADDTARGKESKVDYERKAVQIIRNAREAVLFRWNYELPGQDQA
jgi:hypothetical protein